MVNSDPGEGTICLGIIYCLLYGAPSVGMFVTVVQMLRSSDSCGLLG